MAKVIKAHITGTVWKIEVKVGDAVAEGTVVAILESMKMEMPVESELEGKVSPPSCAPRGRPSREGGRPWSSWPEGGREGSHFGAPPLDGTAMRALLPLPSSSWRSPHCAG